jgi:hypothetical protein
MNRDKSRDHIAILFKFEQQMFQVKTFIRSSVVKEIKRTIRMNDRTCIMVNDKYFNVHVHMFFHLRHKEMILTIQNISISLELPIDRLVVTSIGIRN